MWNLKLRRAALWGPEKKAGILREGKPDFSSGVMFVPLWCFKCQSCGIHVVISLLGGNMYENEIGEAEQTR